MIFVFIKTSARGNKENDILNFLENLLIKILEIMKKLKNFGKSLSRNEMRMVVAGKIDPNGFHACGRNCRVQSPAFSCNNGGAPECRETWCTNQWGTSTDWSFSCGTS